MGDPHQGPQGVGSGVGQRSVVDTVSFPLPPPTNFYGNILSRLVWITYI